MELVIVLAIALALILIRSRFARITIFEFERGLKYRKGKFEKVLGAGRHWFLASSSTVRKLDVRPRYPALLQLRLLQQFGASQGNSLILGFPPPGAPLAVILDKQPEVHESAGEAAPQE